LYVERGLGSTLKKEVVSTVTPDGTDGYATNTHIIYIYICMHMYMYIYTQGQQ